MTRYDRRIAQAVFPMGNGGFQLTELMPGRAPGNPNLPPHSLVWKGAFYAGTWEDKSLNLTVGKHTLT